MKRSSFQFPKFDPVLLEVDPNQLCTADFKNVEVLYELEKHSLVKYGHLLSYKTLYPSSIQKQNVKLALNVFQEKNVAALNCASKDHPNSFINVEETCMFLDIFIKWWKIVNVRTPFEGHRFNDKFREPIRRNSELPIQFLTKMSEWLKMWKKLQGAKRGLSNETFTSIINTIDAFLILIIYMFDNYNIDYILLGKFENDILEGRFSQYRQLSGANFYISFVQLLESERKIRFKNAVLFSCAKDNISLKSILPKYDEEFEEGVSIDALLCVLNYDFSLDIIPKEHLTVLAYIGGYAVRKQLRHKECLICSQWLLSNSEIDFEIPHDLTLELDRGKLMLPSENALIPVAIAWHVMQCFCDNSELLHKFLDGSNQLSKLHKLCLIFLKNQLSHIIFEKCNCNDLFQTKMVQINLIACKIMLNNFVKKQNDLAAEKMAKTEQARKIKKLKSC